ncbi:MAG: hypothetical protein RDV48_19770 [Candidatus Eremiobacteraeota bacterium]|nr:hypothetical protein [Candidatus Eremiobacteraeota bacterium]
MTTRITFTTMGKNYLEGAMSEEDFAAYFEGFVPSLMLFRDEFKQKIEPAIFFNPDSKKLAEKSAAFTAIFDGMERGVALIKESLSAKEKKRFEKGYRMIIDSTEKLAALKTEVSEIMKTMSPL